MLGWTMSMTSTLRAITLIGATLTMGLAAGTMPGLRTTDDRTFVGAFQHMDRAIINPVFMATAFLGALVFTAVAAITNRGTPAMRWIIAALVLYLVSVVITMAVNVPLNDALKGAGDPSHIDVTLARQRFHESRWAAWNLVRVATTTSAFGLLTWALVLYGRATA